MNHSCELVKHGEEATVLHQCLPVTVVQLFFKTETLQKQGEKEDTAHFHDFSKNARPATSKLTTHFEFQKQQ
jgi:hypothetical protein